MSRFRKRQGSEFVIRDAHVVTMDPDLGVLAGADVYVDAGEIVGVTKGLKSSGGEAIDGRGMIVMPGFIDTHWHLWSSVTKNMLRDGGVEYYPVKEAFVEQYRAEDFYAGNRLGLVGAASAGITTVLNFAHNVRSPAHADAELRAMAEIGLRGRYAYGHPDPIAPDEMMPVEDIARVQREWFGDASPFAGLVDLGVALRGPADSTAEVFGAEYDSARRLGLPVALHAGITREWYVSAARLQAEGRLNADTLLVHGLTQSEPDCEALRAEGASVSVSPQAELRTQSEGDFRDQLLQMRKREVNVCLSLDATTLASVSMFDQMSTVWYLGIPWRGTPSERLPRIGFHDCLEMATINGARALGIADKVGSLTPGKRADLIMVRATDLNMVPFGQAESALVRSATVANVDTVIVDGRFVKRSGQLVGVDVEAVKRDAAESLYRLRQRVGGDWAPEEDDKPTY